MLKLIGFDRAKMKKKPRNSIEMGIFSSNFDFSRRKIPSAFKIMPIARYQSIGYFVYFHLIWKASLCDQHNIIKKPRNRHDIDWNLAILGLLGACSGVELGRYFLQRRARYAVGLNLLLPFQRYTTCRGNSQRKGREDWKRIFSLSFPFVCWRLFYPSSISSALFVC